MRSIHEGTVDGPHGDLRPRVYTDSARSRRGLVRAHGGAFMGGDLDIPETDWVARGLAAVGIAIVSVDYRLAPVGLELRHWTTPHEGARYPVASEEVTAAFTWAVGAGLGPPERAWSLGGASAGANLAAGAAMRLRDRGGPGPRSLVLAYPTLHESLPRPSDELREKLTLLTAAELFTPAMVREMNANYVGDAPDPVYAFPATGRSTGSPPS